MFHPLGAPGLREIFSLTVRALRYLVFLARRIHRIKNGYLEPINKNDFKRVAYLLDQCNTSDMFRNRGRYAASCLNEISAPV